MAELSVPSITVCAGAIGMADKENAGIATNAQAAKPINIERFIGVSLRRCGSGAREQCQCLARVPEAGALRTATALAGPVFLENDRSAACSSQLGFGAHAGRTISRIYYSYCVAIKPFAVATIQRLPQRTIESIRPIPGTVSPRVTVQTPSGPSRIAVAPRTSRTVQPSIVVGLVSGTATIISRGGTEAPDGLVLGCTTAAAREDAATTGVPSEPVVAGALRTRPSVLAADFVSASGVRRKYVTFCVAGLKAASISEKRCQFAPPAHPSPNAATKAPAISRALCRPLPSPSGDIKTSSRLRLDKSSGQMIAGCVGVSPSCLMAASSNGSICPAGFGCWPCMI